MDNSGFAANNGNRGLFDMTKLSPRQLPIYRITGVKLAIDVGRITDRVHPGRQAFAAVSWRKIQVADGRFGQPITERNSPIS